MKIRYRASRDDLFDQAYDNPRPKNKYKNIMMLGILICGIIAFGLLTLAFINHEASLVTEQGQMNPSTSQPEIITQEVTTEDPELAIRESLFPISRLETRLQKLVSSEFDGRYPGTQGNDLATEYIRDEMRQIGLVSPEFTDEYLMPFEMILPMKHSATEMSLNVDARIYEFTFGEDFNDFVARDFAKGIGTFEGGYKVIDDPFNLYDFESVGSPEVVVYTEMAISGVSYDALFSEIMKSEQRPKVVLYESSQQNSGYFVLSPYSKMVTTNDNTNGLLIYRISEDVKTLLSESPTGILRFKTEVSIDLIETNNVIGMIDGKGDTGVVISAHFDHLGNNHDGTYNPGALDNASGVTTMLALAEVLVETGDPELDYYFIAFNGEEEGMHGSGHFAAQLPLEPEAFQCFNVDMVGASGNVPLEISATAIQSVKLQEKALLLAESMNIKTFKSDKGSSDHVPLEMAGYETISLTELDKRFYHTPKDTIENSIDFNKMQNVAYFIYRLVFEQ